MISTSRPPATGTAPDQSPVTPGYLQYCLTKYNHRCATGHTTVDRVAAALGLTARPDADPHRWVTSVLNTMINSSTEPDHPRPTPTGVVQ
jgi:hypothetical protein